MMRGRRFIPVLTAVAATALALGGCEMEEPEPGTQADTMAQQPATTQQTGQQPQAIYEARLQALQGSGVSGTAVLTQRNDQLEVTVAATGLDPSTRVPQHIHLNASCDNSGGILLNLDQDLSLPDQGQPQGEAYPQTDDQGRLQYTASRSLQELRTGLTGSGGASADSLDLANRVVKLHDPDMQSISCGPLDRTGQTR